MMTCPECGSDDMDMLGIDPDCDGCSVMECGECGAQTESGEFNGGEEHTCEKA